MAGLSLLDDVYEGREREGGRGGRERGEREWRGREREREGGRKEER